MSTSNQVVGPMTTPGLQICTVPGGPEESESIPEHRLLPEIPGAPGQILVWDAENGPVWADPAP